MYALTSVKLYNHAVYDFGHGGPGFPIWHRFLLMWFERELQWMLGGDSKFAIPFWDWSLDKHRMFPFQEHIYGASEENATLIGNFANWTLICDVTLDVICDPSQSTDYMTRFGNREVYVADYSKWPRREEICKSMTIPVYDSPPYSSKVLGSKSFRNYMEGFYRGNEICNETLFDCSANNTSRIQLHNQVCSDTPTALGIYFVINHQCSKFSDAKVFIHTHCRCIIC